MKKITITNYFPEAECHLSGKTAEAVEVSCEDGSIRTAILSFAELQKLIRFRHRQEHQSGVQVNSTPGGQPGGNAPAK